MRDDDGEPRGPVRRVTIRDVAREAGVRPSTVSKALNGGQGSAAVRRSVEEAAARLGYRPHRGAQGLRRAQSRAIGVLIPDLANPAYLAFLRGVEHAARDQGYVVMIADGQRSGEVTEAVLERFFDQGVDGLVLGGHVGRAALGPYLRHGVPIAPDAPAGGDLGRVRERAETAATREMGGRLLALGHRGFVFLTPPQPPGVNGQSFRRGRLDALTGVVEEAGGELRAAIIDPARGARSCMAKMKRVVAETPATAYVCADHLLAPWLLMTLAEAGLAVPGDASLVLYGDSEWARAHRPALSVVAHDAFGHGHDLAAGLLARLTGTDAPERVMTTAGYIERASCAAPPRTGA